MTNVPPGVGCLVLTATPPPPARSVTARATVVGSATARFSLGALPSGPVTFTASGYAGACPPRADRPAVWVANPVTSTATPGPHAAASLVLEPGSVRVTLTYVGRGPLCPAGQFVCPSATGAATACSTHTEDRNNCGACGNLCQPSQNCVAGACVTPNPCPAGQFVCASATGALGACSTHTEDRSNCGACGNVCLQNQSCVAGRCVSPNACPAGQFVCASATGAATPCSTHSEDRNNCGACGNLCAASQSCVAGRCVSPNACPAGQFMCPSATGAATACSTHTEDRNNCGACGNLCQPNQNCVAGVCVTPNPCMAGQFMCPSATGAATACSTHTEDRNNCGACGNLCQASQACVLGQCTGSNPCAAGQFICSDETGAATACSTHTEDRNNCGACGNALPASAKLRRRASRHAQPLPRGTVHVPERHRRRHRVLHAHRRPQQLRRLRQPLSAKPELRRRRLRHAQLLPRRPVHLPAPQRRGNAMLHAYGRPEQLRRLRQPLSASAKLHQRRLRHAQLLSRRPVHLPHRHRRRHPLLAAHRRSQQLRRLRKPLRASAKLRRRRLRNAQPLPRGSVHVSQRHRRRHRVLDAHRRPQQLRRLRQPLPAEPELHQRRLHHAQRLPRRSVHLPNRHGRRHPLLHTLRGPQQLRRLRQPLRAAAKLRLRRLRHAQRLPRRSVHLPNRHGRRHPLLHTLRGPQQLRRLRQPLRAAAKLRLRRLRHAQRLPRRSVHLPNRHGRRHPLLHTLRGPQQLRRLRQPLRASAKLRRWRLHHAQQLPRWPVHLPHRHRRRHPVLHPFRGSQQLRRLRQPLRAAAKLRRWRLHHAQRLPRWPVHLPHRHRRRHPVLHTLRRSQQLRRLRQPLRAAAKLCRWRLHHAQRCPAGQFICPTATGAATPCSTHSEDRNNCGACGNLCAANQRCLASICQ